MTLVDTYHPGAPPTHRLLLLGVLEDRTMVGNTLNALRIIAWKFVIAQFTQVDMEGAKFCADTVWRMAVRRLITRLNSAEWAARIAMTAKAGALETVTRRATAKMAPLAKMTPSGAQWGEALVVTAREAGAEPQAQWSEASAPKLCHATGIQFLKATRCEEEIQSAPTYDPVSDRDGLAWHVQYRVLTKKVGEQVRIYLQTVADTRDIVEIKQGCMLPLRETPNEDFAKMLCRAVRRAKAEPTVVYARPQLCVFAPGAERDSARDYALDLVDAGLTEMHQVTLVSAEDCDHNITQEARTLYRTIVDRDRWLLRGPKVTMTDSRDDELEQAELEGADFELDLEIEAELNL